MADKQKRDKPHVEIGTIGYVGFGKTSLQKSIEDALKKENSSWITPIDFERDNKETETIRKRLNDSIIDISKDEPQGPQMG